MNPPAMSARCLVRSLLRLTACLGAGLLLAAIARAGAPRVLAPGQLPQDRRLGDLKDLNGYCPFTPCPTKQAWAVRSERLRRQLLVANGLWPMPTKSPDHAVVHGRVDREGYTVERVFFESFPGHFVTGSLYRPKGRTGRLPGVLCPHGHWPNGRFYDAGPQAIRQSLVEGAERFELSGRYPLQARCVTLARMGCIVFHYDMVGFADSVQLGHGPGYRPAMSTPKNWGYFSPQAEAHAQNMMGLQTYNSIRALDWFSGLEDVDPERIAVTGASGGGTQTFILCALDPRPTVAFPAVMVGTAMQGGCTCENACLLRVGTGNVEISALIAPRPLGMTAADDWTKDIMTKGLPELKQHYALFGAEDRVMAKALIHFPHNYNYVSRAVMYAWLNKHLKLGLKEPVVEEDFKPLSEAELTVWDKTHPKPKGGEGYERSLLKWITEDSRRQMEALVPRDAASLERYRKAVGGAVDVMIGRGLPPANALRPTTRHTTDLRDCRMSTLVLSYPDQKEAIPVVRLDPKKEVETIVIWLDGRGKQALFDDAGSPKPEVHRLLADGAAVIGADLFGQGEFTRDGKPLAKARVLNHKALTDKKYADAKDRWDPTDDWGRYLGYTLGYNPPLFAQRVHDVLSVIAYARQGRRGSERIVLMGLHGSGPWAAAARAQAGAAVDEAVIDTGGFRFAKITALDDPDLLPGGAKYLDLPGILALSAPHKLALYGEGQQAPPVVAAAYQAAGHPENLAVPGGKVP